MSKKELDKRALLEIIKNQNKQLEYTGYYIAFLLGCTSEKEFEEISKKFIIKSRRKPMNKKYTLIRNDERYGLTERQKSTNPPKIFIKGTLKQARYMAEIISLNEPGCEFYYYVLEEGNEVGYCKGKP